MIIKKEIPHYLITEFGTIRSALTKIDGNETGSFLVWTTWGAYLVCSRMVI